MGAGSKVTFSSCILTAWAPSEGWWKKSVARFKRKIRRAQLKERIHSWRTGAPRLAPENSNPSIDSFALEQASDVDAKLAPILLKDSGCDAANDSPSPTLAANSATTMGSPGNQRKSAESTFGWETPTQEDGDDSDPQAKEQGALESKLRFLQYHYPKKYPRTATIADLPCQVWKRTVQQRPEESSPSASLSKSALRIRQNPASKHHTVRIKSPEAIRQVRAHQGVDHQMVRNIEVPSTPRNSEFSAAFTCRSRHSARLSLLSHSICTSSELDDDDEDDDLDSPSIKP